MAWKIYDTGRAGYSSSRGKIWPIALAVADSGALYTAGVLAQLIAYETKSNGQYCSLAILTPLIVSNHSRSLTFPGP
jgi:hypothetical protein